MTYRWDSRDVERLAERTYTAHMMTSGLPARDMPTWEEIDPRLREAYRHDAGRRLAEGESI